MRLTVARRWGSVVAVVFLLSVLLVPAVAGASSTVYVVQAGDTLYSIAVRYGVSMSSIASANGIANYNHIYVGQQLVIPGSGGSGGVHVVRAGETLASIAWNYGVSLYDIAAANGLTNLNWIYPGQRLTIPGGGYTPPQPAPTTYTVRYGDTLASIAARFGTTWVRLMQLNGLSNANFIYAGQVLRISGTAPAPAPAPHPVPPPAPQPVGSWSAQYFNTQDLSGSPVLTRKDANINFNWGFGSPAAQVYPDHFSVRWTRTFNMSGGTYRVTARSDDGVRVYIDGVSIIDAWVVQAATTYMQDVVIPTGNHTFVVEFFEAEGVAEINVSSQKL